MRFPLLLALLLTSTFALAQFKITGIISENNKKTAGASVLLLSGKDSALVKSALSNTEGFFAFEGVATGNYMLSITKVGAQAVSLQIEVLDKDVKLKEVQLQAEAKSLAGVTVTATRPFLEQRADKLIVNVENSPTAAGSTALEVLQKVPGVIITNDRVSLVGKSSLNIMIDGRPSPYTDITQVLRDMPSSNIEKIEVIHNPGAKYEAAGGAVINIILKRNANLGTNGNVSLTTGLGLFNQEKDEYVDQTFYRVSPAISLNHRKGDWNLYGGYSFLRRTYFEVNEFDRSVGNNQFSQRNYAPGEVSSHNFRLGADYYMDKKNTVGLLLRGFHREGSSSTINATTQRAKQTGQQVSNFQSINEELFKRRNLSANINWKHSFDTLGKVLNVDVDHAIYSLNNRSLITNRRENRILSTNNQEVENPVDFSVFKADYTHPLNQDAKIETGVKSTFATIDNDLIFRRNGMIDNTISSQFIYKENINAAYVSYQHKWEKWEFTGGLRAEQTIAKGETGKVRTLDRNYLQWFPSAFLTRKITSDLSTVLQYSRRVNRPSFQQQNPFIFFLDSLTYTRGNPLLRPEITDGGKMSVTYKGQPFFGVSFNRTSDVIFQNAPKQVGDTAYATPENLARFDNVAIELNFPIQLGKKISGFGGNQLIRNHYKAEYLGGMYDEHRWHWMVYGQVTYKPSATLSIEASGFYMTKFLNEFITIQPMGNINFAVAKSFWNKKGRLSLNFSDVLYSNQTNAQILYQDIDVSFRERSDSRNVRLVFNYSFGNQQLKAARNRTTAADAETNRVKTN
jgi:hypothetical protein